MGMIPECFYLTAIDPGGTTGMSLMSITPDDYKLISTAAVPYKIRNGKVASSPLDTLKQWHAGHTDMPHIFLYEAFHIRPGQKAVDTTAFDVLSEVRRWMTTGLSPEHFAVLEVLARLRRHPVASNPQVLSAIEAEEEPIIKAYVGGESPYLETHSQEPAQAKRQVPDEVLRCLGLYCKSHGRDSRHVNDSLRHSVTWLARLPHIPMCERAWPQRATLPL